MNTSRNLQRPLEILGRDDDEPPSRGFEQLPPLAITLPLAGIAFVLPAVILDENPEAAIDEVATSDETAVLIEDADVDFWNR